MLLQKKDAFPGKKFARVLKHHSTRQYYVLPGCLSHFLWAKSYLFWQFFLNFQNNDPKLCESSLDVLILWAPSFKWIAAYMCWMENVKHFRDLKSFIYCLLPFRASKNTKRYRKIWKSSWEIHILDFYCKIPLHFSKYLTLLYSIQSGNCTLHAMHLVVVLHLQLCINQIA